MTFVWECGECYTLSTTTAPKLIKERVCDSCEGPLFLLTITNKPELFIRALSTEMDCGV